MQNYTSKKVWAFGEICYYNSEGQYHRIDGPAVEWPDGNNGFTVGIGESWYINGKHHRLDGPAVRWSNRDNFWYIYGQIYLKVEHNRLVLFSILEPQRIELCPTKD